MTDDSNNRLARIEEKLDELGKAIVAMARLEERMITLFNRMSTYDAAQTLLASRVAEIERAKEKVRRFEGRSQTSDGKAVM